MNVESHTFPTIPFAIKLLTFLCALGALLEARPVAIPTIEEMMTLSSVVVVIRPESVRQTSDRPDDNSFGDRDMTRYQPLETTCRIVTSFKGTVTEPTIKIVHFAYADPKPEFNGGLMMSFLFDPILLVSFPTLANGKPDTSRGQPYASNSPEYLAFLRRLPDGRYAAASPHYDAATSFRLLSQVLGAQRYHHHPAAKPPEQPKK